MIHGHTDIDNPPDQIGGLRYITPQLATQLLKNNSRNFREMKKHRIPRLIESIQNNGWNCDGNAIKMDQDGYLIDGQHRLQVIANTPGLPGAWCWVIRGISSDRTIDTGAKRSIGDMLKSQGEKNVKELSALLPMIWWMDLGSGPIGHYATMPTIMEMMDALEKHPTIRRSISVTMQCRHIGYISAFAYVHYAASLHDETMADMFIESVSSGEMLKTNDPVYKLRTRLLENKGKPRRLPRAEIMALIIKAWNLWSSGRACSILRWRQVGPRSEPFPEVEAPE